MPYCAADDVRLLTGVSVSDLDDSQLLGLIRIADTRCDALMTASGIPTPLSTDEVPNLLKDASAHFSAALVLDRKRIDLSRPASLALDGSNSFATSPDTEISHQESLGTRSLELYISGVLKSLGTPTGTIIHIVEGD